MAGALNARVGILGLPVCVYVDLAKALDRFELDFTMVTQKRTERSSAAKLLLRSIEDASELTDAMAGHRLMFVGVRLRK